MERKTTTLLKVAKELSRPLPLFPMFMVVLPASYLFLYTLLYGIEVSEPSRIRVGIVVAMLGRPWMLEMLAIVIGLTGLCVQLYTTRARNTLLWIMICSTVAFTLTVFCWVGWSAGHLHNSFMNMYSSGC